MSKFTTQGLLTQTCDIYERAATVSGKQAVAPTPALKVNGVRCRVWPISARERASALGQTVEATHRMIMRTAEVPAGFRASWEVQVGAVRYRVQEVVDAGGAGEVTMAQLVVVR